MAQNITSKFADLRSAVDVLNAAIKANPRLTPMTRSPDNGDMTIGPYSSLNRPLCNYSFDLCLRNPDCNQPDEAVGFFAKLSSLLNLLSGTEALGHAQAKNLGKAAPAKGEDHSAVRTRREKLSKILGDFMRNSHKGLISLIRELTNLISSLPKKPADI
jgi:hypothetical protein